MHVDERDTPSVVVDINIADANLKRAQVYADSHGLPLRPHIKTHKLPFFAKRQIDLGAIGITCQKLGEAEVMADHGIADIFLPYNILGAQKLKRLRALHERITLSVTADSQTTISGYAQAFADAGKPLPVLVECDTGAGRCGVQTAEEALSLAQSIDHQTGLTFTGLMTYPPRGDIAGVDAWLSQARDAILAVGLPVTHISNGGSPDLYSAHGVTAATEHRPGTYIYGDRMQVDFGLGSLDDCALTVLATVVSRPTENRAVVDAGSKVLAADLCNMPGHGTIREYPDAIITALSEEHGVVDLGQCTNKPAVGDHVRIIPNHVCVVSNLVDTVTLVDGETVIKTLPIVARGKVG